MPDSPDASIPLGLFHLQRRIGQGGMAEVWSGVHAVQQVPVAVKVMTAERARNSQYRAAFRNEVQSMASLDHPGIVMVFDHGVVSPEAEEVSCGLLPAGSPCLAMELSDRGTLAAIPPESRDWTELRRTLLDLLDALGHAHARGVIHRDLKPSNVLLFDGAGTIRLKLADFGLAQAFELQVGPDSTDFVCGTPTYMAPEQLRGEWRDYGPWTDLYGLGCLAWTLATGVPPFHEPGLLQLVRLQLEEDPPPFKPLFAMPSGFEGFLRRLLQKEPGRRFVRAADAAWTLMRLGEPTLTPIPSPAPPSPRESPPLPATWAPAVSRPPSMKLVGAGLGLYGLRSIPLVGRRAERDVLWQTLAEVHSEQRVRFVLLRGAAGNGKTRLAEGIAERA
ncbi:MAG TPA: serine/threonine-protein kinase, partial [Thermoanaerobaculia bacterium]|nr:serine/threonine-protein kinase [Thermoanaerobaculia bacterium]